MKGKKTGGRVAGTPNKLTSTVKEMVLAALDGVGGLKYLKKQAYENPTAFLTLVGRIIPTEITGAGGGNLTIEIVKYAKPES